MATEQLHRPKTTTETCHQNTQEQQNWFKRNMAHIGHKQKEHSTTTPQPTQVKEHHYHPTGWWPGQKHNTATATKPTLTSSNHAPQVTCQKTSTNTNNNHAPQGPCQKTSTNTINNHAPQGPCQKTGTNTKNNHAPQAPCQKTSTNTNNNHAPQGPCQTPAPMKVSNPTAHQANKKNHAVVYEKNYTIAEPIKDHAVFGRNYTIAEIDKTEHAGYGRNYTIAEVTKTENVNAHKMKEDREQQNANHCFRSVAGHVKQRITMMRGGHNDAASYSSDSSSDSECETDAKKKKEKKHQKGTIVVTAK